MTRRHDHDPATPPPFPGAKRRRGCGPGMRDWEYQWFGKRPNQSWSEYLGLAPARGRRHHGSYGTSGEAADASGMGDDMDIHTGSPNPHRLYRSRTDAKLGGVCAGIGNYLNIDSWIVRVIFVVGFFVFTPVFLFGYPILWWILKPQPMGLYESEEEEVFWRSVTTKPDQTLSALRSKFRDLDREIGRLETYIASREYDLHRQFRDLESK